MRRIIALLVMICFVAGTFAKVPVTGNKIRLTDNWEFLRQDVGNIWELSCCEEEKLEGLENGKSFHIQGGRLGAGA